MKLALTPKQLFTLAFSCMSLWAMPCLAQQQQQLTFTGRVLPQCAFVMGNYRGNQASVLLKGNRGSISTICNTGSTLSVSIDRADLTDSETRNAKIRFAAGGTGIYANANRDTRYRDTIRFSTNGVTRAIGDTAQIEVNVTDCRQHLPEIVVFASLTPQ
jgi:hypothetical protein